MFNRICVFVLVCFFAGAQSKALEFPASIPRCKFSDTECLRDVMTDVIQSQTAGNDEFGLMPLDPLKLDKLTILQNEDSPVNIRLHLTNITLTGIRDVVITKVVGFDEIPMQSKFEVTGKTKKLTIFGKYVLGGKVLILPVTGRGNANFTFENVTITVKVLPHTEMRDGQEFAVVKHVKCKFSTTKFIPSFTNLLVNDEGISNSLNSLMQEHSYELFKEMRAPIEGAVAEVVKVVLSGPFGKFPYRDLFVV